jgi:hypothetical protein
MRRFSMVSLLFALVLHVHAVHGQQLTVQADAGKQVVLSRSDIESLTHIQVKPQEPPPIP